MMDNPIFRVNGKSGEHLQRAIALVMEITGHKTANAWWQSEEHGLVLRWSNGGFTVGAGEAPDGGPLPPMKPETVAGFVCNWLTSEFAKQVKVDSEMINMEHDGHNSIGWLVYTGPWGHVGPDHYAIFAVKPGWLWIGK